jgi:biopolymer transport protein ExbD
MTKIPNPRSQKRARIEIIPLIDIMFFLLATFVMVSLSMGKNQGIPVNLPAAATGKAQSREESTVISIQADGAIFLDKKAVTPEQLDASLRAVVAANPSPLVFINGDKKAEFGAAIAILDQVRKLGISRISIETEPLSKKQ